MENSLMPLTLQYYSFPFLPPFSEIKEPYPAANAPARKHRWISYAEEQLSVDAKGDRPPWRQRPQQQRHNEVSGELLGENLFTILQLMSCPWPPFHKRKIWSIFFIKLLRNTDTIPIIYSQNFTLLASRANGTSSALWKFSEASSVRFASAMERVRTPGSKWFVSSLPCRLKESIFNLQETD